MTQFVFSIDDAGSGAEAMIDSFRRTCAWFEELGVRGTWFVVPRAGDRPMSEAWATAFAAGRDAGHDLQLHGLTHSDCYEFGPPAWPATNVKPDFVTDFEARRDELLPRYTVDRLRARLEQGLEVFDQRLGLRPTAFRAPCGARSTALYEALHQVGIGYESCVYLSATGYEHLEHRSGQIESCWQPEVPPQPFRWYSGVVQCPILNEYTWRGSGQRSDEFLALARADLARIAEVSDLAVVLMHTHGIADDYDHAFRVVRAVVEQVSGEGLGGFATLGELIASGAVDAAAVDGGPRDLPV